MGEIVKSMTLFTLNPDIHTVDIPPDAEVIRERGLGTWREILHSTYGRCRSLELGKNVTRQVDLFLKIFKNKFITAFGPLWKIFRP